MKVIIIGLGSMGQRRIRLLRQLYSSNISVTGVDSNVERLKKTTEELGIQGVSSLEEALKDIYDCAFVCTSPLSHANIIRHLLEKNLYVFTELNLVKDGYTYFMRSDNFKKLFLSSTLQYRKDIEYIQEKVGGQRTNYIYHSGQYLPDWHPWESFKDYFVNDCRTNACREIMAIDFPWIIATFGKIKTFYVVSGKCSSLDVSYNDTYHILLEHENGTQGSISIDIVSRKATRKLEVYSENMHIYWDGTPESLTEYDIKNKQTIKISLYENITKDPNYCPNIIENAYEDEITAFMSIVENQDYSKVKYTVLDDNYTLDLIDKIENIS